jgi:hypothetical protein
VGAALAGVQAERDALAAQLKGAAEQVAWLQGMYSHLLGGTKLLAQMVGGCAVCAPCVSRAPWCVSARAAAAHTCCHARRHLPPRRPFVPRLRGAQSQVVAAGGQVPEDVQTHLGASAAVEGEQQQAQQQLLLAGEQAQQAQQAQHAQQAQQQQAALAPPAT